MNMKASATEVNFKDVTKEQLIKDFKVVMSDAEELIKATANQGGEALAAVRAKTEASLSQAKAKIIDAEAALLEHAKAAAKATNIYVHQNPWQAVGITAGIGLLVGFVLGRR